MNEETTPAAEPHPNPSPDPDPTPGRWRDRTVRLQAVAAVAVAALLVGGGAGALIGYVAHDDGHDRPHIVQMGGGPGERPGGHGIAPPGGQLPPGIAPDAERDVQPEGSDT